MTTTGTTTVKPIIVTSVTGSIIKDETIRVDKKRMAYCYSKGRLGAKNDCNNCNNPDRCVLLQLSPRKNSLLISGTKKYAEFNKSALESFLKTQGGVYTGSAVVCGTGSIVAGSSCKQCKTGLSSRACRVIDIAMSK